MSLDGVVEEELEGLRGQSLAVDGNGAFVSLGVRGLSALATEE